ncbi:MAG: hypothetical protein K5640_02010 [Treponema sp.]|nr:hypothetical protein [Treponema sp.]
MALQDNKTEKVDTQFYYKINSLFAEIQQETNPLDRKNRCKKLIDEVWRELSAKWKSYKIEEYTVEITTTVTNCLKNYKSEKGKAFSNYLLSALKFELKNAELKTERKEEIRRSKETPFEIVDEDGDPVPVTDIAKPDFFYNLESFERMDFIDKIKSVLANLQAAFTPKEQAKENYKIIRAIVTSDFLEDFDDFRKKTNLNLELQYDDVFNLHKEFSFIDKKVWTNFFEKHLAASRAVIAAAWHKTNDYVKNTVERFYERHEEIPYISKKNSTAGKSASKPTIEIIGEV